MATRDLDRAELVKWARERFQVELSEEDLKSKQRDEIRAELVQRSLTSQQAAESKLAEVRQRVDKLFGDNPDGVSAAATGANGQLDSLREWAAQSLKCQLSERELAEMTRDDLRRILEQATEDQFRPEIRRMERSLVLQLVDTAWKDHLLGMDHLRSAVGLVGYAQVDPKVEYKREGMRLFETMWNSIGDRITDLIFRMEQLDERFVGSTWVETAAVHEQAPGASEIARQQQQAIEGSQGGNQKTEPIRNRGKRQGRNEPCSCGSGKKYKNCCMRNAV